METKAQTMGDNRVMNDAFLKNKYAKWYNLIINNRRHTPCGCNYAEKHHILPRCLGGNNEHVNIVRLSAREHLLCHRLLVKMTRGRANQKMIHALWMMLNSARYCKIAYLTYEKIKILKSKNMKGNRIASYKHSLERIEQNRLTQTIVQNKPEVKAKTAATKAKPENKIRYSTIMKEVMSRQDVIEKIRKSHERKVIQIDPVTQEEVAVFCSAKEAELLTGTNRSKISECVNGKRKHAGGFNWKFMVVENKI